LEGFTEKFEDTLNGIHLDDEGDDPHRIATVRPAGTYIIEDWGLLPWKIPNSSTLRISRSANLSTYLSIRRRSLRSTIRSRVVMKL
jgi:hypothetical protein